MIVFLNCSFYDSVFCQGPGGITEAEAGAMRGRQDLPCHQDQLWLQDTKTGTLPRMHSLEIE